MIYSNQLNKISLSMEISEKTGENVEEMFEELTKMILKDGI